MVFVTHWSINNMNVSLNSLCVLFTKRRHTWPIRRFPGMSRLPIPQITAMIWESVDPLTLSMALSIGLECPLRMVRKREVSATQAYAA